MENLILKICARDALNNILKQNNSTKYQQLCLYVEDNYSEIEKEIAFVSMLSSIHKFRKSELISVEVGSDFSFIYEKSDIS